jgi:hypothetical protein
MKQVKVSLPDWVVDHLSKTADREQRSLSEEIRERIAQSVRQDSLAPETLGLHDSITNLAALVEQQTGHPWYSHPAATLVLQDAIVARLERARGGVKEAAFRLDELPPDHRIVGSADQRMWGAALEAIDVHIADQENRGALPLPRYGAHLEPFDVDERELRGRLRSLTIVLARIEETLRGAEQPEKKMDLARQKAAMEEEKADLEAKLKKLWEGEKDDGT